ncbi:DciA family protein [Pasteurellaceae bacterium 22721_9_1]
MSIKRYQKTVNVKQLLEKSDFAQLMQKGLQIYAFDQHIQKVFPSQFKGLYRVANFTEDTLHFEVANAMVRQAFLFQQKVLLTQIQQSHPHIQHLQFKINPALS